MRVLLKTSLATAILLSLGSAATAQAGDGGTPIFDNIKVKGELRPRYETVDEDNANSKATAMTNRLVIGAQADLFGTKWLSAYAEMTDVHNVNNNYNSTNNGQGDYSVVIDPEQTRLTQSYLDFTFGKTVFRAGRQIINYDNLRFIGAVNWRQMPQSFDTYAVVDNSIANLNLNAVYIKQVNRIFADSDKSRAKANHVLLRAKYKASDALALTGYGYLLGSIHNTYGLAATGKTDMSGTKISYRAEYATQTDASLEVDNDGKPTIDADYMNLKVDANMSGVLLGAMYEVLSGSNDTAKPAFSTPLATLHAQNGWADNFINTPTTGLVDMNVTVGYKAKGFGVAKAIYHDYSSDAGSINYGSEFDLLYKNAVPGFKNLKGLVKAAMYSGGDSEAAGNSARLATDKTVFWLMLDYKFSS